MSFFDIAVVKKIAAFSAIRLREMYENTDNVKRGLIFPYYRKLTDSNGNLKLRISEQEARAIFISFLEDAINECGYNICYSVETPTRLTYTGFAKQNGKTVEPKVYLNNSYGSSGSIDVSLFSADLKNPKYNIEFKCGNPEPQSFKKDLLKLYSEAAEGIWFHIYEGDKHSLKSIKDKLTTSRNVVISNCLKPITVFIVSVRKDKNNNPPALETYIMNPTGSLVKE